MNTRNNKQKPPGQLARVYFEVTIGIGLVVIVFMAVIIIAFCSGKNIFDQKDRDSILEFSLKTVTAGLGVVSLYYVADSIRSVAKARSDDS